MESSKPLYSDHYEPIMFNIAQAVQTVCVYAIPLLFAITMHEAAHGWVASKMGDQTARLMGRVTLNPLPHVDPVGTVILPLIMLLGSSLAGMGGMIFGWAKPVPVVTRYLRDQRWGMVWVAAAGPLSNLLQGLVWALLAKLLLVMGFAHAFFLEMCVAGISVNFVLMALNLVPILPLDGGRILNGFLPWRWSRQFERIEPYGIFILLVLMASGLLGVLMRPFLMLANGFLNLVL